MSSIHIKDSESMASRALRHLGSECGSLVGLGKQLFGLVQLAGSPVRCMQNEDSRPLASGALRQLLEHPTSEFRSLVGLGEQPFSQAHTITITVTITITITIEP